MEPEGVSYYQSTINLKNTLMVLPREILPVFSSKSREFRVEVFNVLQ